MQWPSFPRRCMQGVASEAPNGRAGVSQRELTHFVGPRTEATEGASYKPPADTPAHAQGRQATEGATLLKAPHTSLL